MQCKQGAMQCHRHCHWVVLSEWRACVYCVCCEGFAFVLHTRCHLYASTCYSRIFHEYFYKLKCIVWTMFLLVFERLNKNCTVDKLSRYIGPPWPPWNPSHAAASTFSQESIDHNFTHLTPVIAGRSQSLPSSMDVYRVNSFWRFQFVHRAFMGNVS